MIRRLFGLIFNRWVFLAIIFACIALTIWLFGDLLGVGTRQPLASESSRLIAIVAVGIFIVALVAWQTWRSRRTNAAVVTQLIVKPTDESKGAESADLAAVRQRFEQAMQTLRRTRFGKGGIVDGWAARFGGRYVYELPWYLIIGAPGSGKTTALENCGLQFPLQSKLGQSAVRGVGGTRNCDWWFTDQAVLIDTAGRFTTQDSDAANDRATWSSFLQILQRARPRQPINGVLLTVSVTDLLTRSVTERRDYATTVRTRLQELHEDLGVRIPIYLLVTKCDLVAGFMDYFASLDKEQRAAAWGVTFPADQPTAAHLKTFDDEFAELSKRLDDGLVEQLQTERDPQRRARVYGFPNEFACIKAPLDEFLDIVFSPSPYEQETLLRGVYFISGTQEGTPIDRVMSTVARTFGLQRALITPNQTAGRSYFLSRLLGEVVFAERGLAGTNLQWERRRRLLAIGAYAAIALLTVGLVAMWYASYASNLRYVAEVAARAEELRKQTRSANMNVSVDPRTVMPTLDAMRGLADAEDHPWRFGFGLSQTRKLETAARNAYDRMLYALLMPNLEIRAEERIRQEFDRPESLYESLRAYLMLHDAAHFDAATLKRYFDTDTDRRLGRLMADADRASLENHLDALLAQGASPTLHAPDKPLIDSVRQRIMTTSLPDRVLERLRSHSPIADYPDFSIQSAAGGATRILFSADALNAKVPGFFTYNAYHKGFDGQVLGAAHELDDEQDWVLGSTKPKPVGGLLADDLVLATQVRKLYLNAYTAAWKQFIAAIRLKSFSSSSDAIQVAQQLSAPDNPLKPLLTKVSRETTLSAPLPGAAATIANNVNRVIGDQKKALANALGGPKVEPAADLEKALVDDQFDSLHAQVTAGPDGKAPIDMVVTQIATVQQQMIAADRAVQAKLPPPPSVVTPVLQAEISQQPEPIRSLMTALTEQGAKKTTEGLRANLSNEVRAQFGEFCQRAISGRYPFNRASSTEVQLQDFTTIFGPGGNLEKLMIKLGQYVDTNAKPWRFVPVDGMSLGDSGALVQLQRAQTIHDTFFVGATTPTIRVTFLPVEMDSELSLFSMDVDGQVVRYQHGPLIPTPVTWPGTRATGQVRLSVTPAAPPGTPNLIFDGPWALLRMVDNLKLEPTGVPDQFNATFIVGKHWAKFHVSAASVRNPLNMPELREFKCPMGL